MLSIPAQKEGNRQSGTPENHGHHDNLVSDRQQRVHSGDDLTCHHSGKGYEPNRQKRVHLRDQRRLERHRHGLVGLNASGSFVIEPLPGQADCGHGVGENHSGQRNKIVIFSGLSPSWIITSTKCSIGWNTIAEPFLTRAKMPNANGTVKQG